MSSKNSLIVRAAIAGLLAAASANVASAATAEKGHCMGANSCKGKSDCKTAENDCKGQNGCKGKGFLENTEAKCKNMAKKAPSVHWEKADKT